jgi:uncharacterized protein YdhG (YjbR/CyaY superfamily)
MPNRPTYTTIDEYIATFPAEVQPILEQVRQTIRAAAPEAQESISYQIAAFKLRGHALIYFAGYKKHIGVYPVPLDAPEFKEELAPYASGKATAQFPLNKPIPLELIHRLTLWKAQAISGQPAKRS